MKAPTQLTAFAAVSFMVALGGCSGSDSSSSEGDTSGPPPCSDFASGETITEELTLAGCTDEGVSVNESTVCDSSKRLIAVGPVYGVVGEAANYLGEGEDATQSPDWDAFKQSCGA